MTVDEKHAAPANGREELFRKQKQTLDLFLEKKAITRQQYEKSLHDLAEKMGFDADVGNEQPSSD